MLNSHTLEKEIVRLRTRSSLRSAASQMNMVRNTRQTSVGQKPMNSETNETDVDHLATGPPPQDTFSNDSEKLDFLCREMTKVASLAQEVKELKRLNVEKDKRINDLENRIDDLEQYSRQDNLIITGFKYRHLSYSRAANPDQEVFNHENSTEQEKVSLEDQVVELLQKHEIPIDKDSISACHTLPSKNRPQDRPIVIRFTSRKAKIKVLQNSRKLKKDQTKPAIYINEHLTSKNNMIAKEARRLRREGKIENTWTRNCKIFIKYRMANGDEKVMIVKHMNVLNALSS